MNIPVEKKTNNKNGEALLFISLNECKYKTLEVYCLMKHHPPTGKIKGNKMTFFSIKWLLLSSAP